MCAFFCRFGYTFVMRRIAATLAVVVALLFSAGSAKADFLDDLFDVSNDSSAEDTFEGVYCKGTGKALGTVERAYKRDQSCKYGDKRIDRKAAANSVPNPSRMPRN